MACFFHGDVRSAVVAPSSKVHSVVSTNSLHPDLSNHAIVDPNQSAGPRESQFTELATSVSASPSDIEGVVGGRIVDPRDARNAAILADEPLVDQIRRHMKKAQESFKKMKVIGARVPAAFKNASYFEDSSITIVEPEAGSIVVDFGYSGAGDVTMGFLGTKTRLEIEGLPDYILVEALDSFASLAKGTGVDRILIVNPSDEFLLKLIVLGASKISNKVDTGEFIKEFHLLLARLYRIPSGRGLNGVIDGFPPIFVDLIKEIKVGKRSIYDLLTWYGKEFEGMLNYDFSQPPKFSPTDHAQLFRHVITVFLHSAMSYQSEKRSYLKSPEGQQAHQELQAVLKASTGIQGVKDKKAAYSAFNAGMPGFAKVKQEVLSRLMMITKAPPFVRLKEKIKEMIKSFMDELGMSDSELDASPDLSGVNFSEDDYAALLAENSEDLLFASAEQSSEADASEKLAAENTEINVGDELGSPATDESAEAAEEPGEPSQDPAEVLADLSADNSQEPASEPESGDVAPAEAESILEDVSQAGEVALPDMDPTALGDDAEAAVELPVAEAEVKKAQEPTAAQAAVVPAKESEKKKVEQKPSAPVGEKIGAPVKAPDMPEKLAAQSAGEVDTEATKPTSEEASAAEQPAVDEDPAVSADVADIDPASVGDWGSDLVDPSAGDSSDASDDQFSGPAETPAPEPAQAEEPQEEKVKASVSPTQKGGKLPPEKKDKVAAPASAEADENPWG